MPDNINQNASHGKLLIAWRFPEYLPQHRGRAWYIWTLAIAAAILIWSIIVKNYLFTLIIIIIGIIFYLQNRRAPDLLDCRILEDGLELGRNFYPFRDINKFYIIYHPPEVKSLYLEFKSSVRPALPIPLEKENPLKIREILKKYLNEDLEKEDEPTSDAITRTLKF